MTGSPRAPAAAGRGAQGAAAPDGRADAQGGAATLIALALFAIVVMAVLVAVDLGALAGARAQAQTAANVRGRSPRRTALARRGASAGRWRR